MIKRLALLIGVSMLASACSSQGPDTADTASAEDQDHLAPKSIVDATAGAYDTQDTAQTGVGSDNTGVTDLGASAPVTGERIVDCKIMSGGEEVLDAPCNFSPQTNGGFTLMSKSGEGAIYGNILSVSVSKIGSTTAEVRGMTSDGVNSRWGQATRSQQDPACWNGSDFSVCAY